MAKSKIPDPLARRHLVSHDLNESQALQYAEAYLADGRAIEAIDFLAKAGATERLAEVRSDAVAAGDAFLLRAVATLQGAPMARQEWVALAEAAEAAGKERYAEEARRYAERDE